DSGLPYAGGDDHHGGLLAGRHLLACGYRKLAVVGGPHHATTSRDRIRGFVDALTEAGIALPNDYIKHGPFDVTGGIAAATALFDAIDPPDAIFAVSDSIAIGILGVARDRGLAIPEQLGVIGYNDIPFAAQLPVPLSTVVTPAHDIGAAGVRLLLEFIADPDTVPADIVLPVELVARGSTRALAALI
ncbi:MAG: substrate-binding domain-containing protein, partial [Gordonia sp. (in: high G+C Gram-positive bacteria)]